MTEPAALLARSLGAEDAALLLPWLEEQSLADRELLLREGVPSTHVYFVIEGQLDVVHETPTARVELAVRGPGTWLGEVGLVDQGPATATVSARGPARVLRLGHARLMRLVTDDPAAASVLLRHANRTLAERIAAGSAGLVEEVTPGVLRLARPDAAPGFAARLLGLLLGGAA